jgi:hypothetical protein
VPVSCMMHAEPLLQIENARFAYAGHGAVKPTVGILRGADQSGVASGGITRPSHVATPFS